MSEKEATATVTVEAVGASADAVGEIKDVPGEKKEIKLFNSIGGVALSSNSGTKSGRQITPGELRIQRGMNNNYF